MGFTMVFLSLLALPVPDAVLHLDQPGTSRTPSGGGRFPPDPRLQGAGGRRAAPARGLSGGAGGSGPVEAGPPWSAPGSAPPVPARPERHHPAPGGPARHPRPLAGASAGLARSGPPPPGQARLPAPQAAGPSTGSAAAASARRRAGRHRRGRARGRGAGQRHAARATEGHAATPEPREESSELPRHGTRPGNYGGWRRRRGIGMFGFGRRRGPPPWLGALLALIIHGHRGCCLPRLAVPRAPGPCWPAGLGLARIGGEPLAVAAGCGGCAGSYGLGRGTGPATGPRWWAGPFPRVSPCPGVLAPLTLLDCEDGYGGRYGIVAGPPHRPDDPHACG